MPLPYASTAMFLPAAVRRFFGQIGRRLQSQGRHDQQPIVLHTRRIFILPTANGLVFGAAMVVLLLLSINYALNLGYVILFMLAGTGLVSVFRTFLTLRGLVVRPGKAIAVFAGETARFPLLLENLAQPARLGVCLLGPQGRVPLNLPADSISEATLCVPTRHRGWLALEPICIETRYPFGFFRAWSMLHFDYRCLVYPAPEANPPALPPPYGGTLGENAGNGNEEEFAGLRNFRPTDSLRRVAWKTVARDGVFMVKQFTGPAGGKLMLRWQDLPHHLDDEARLARLTAWALNAHARNMAFSLQLPDCQMVPASGSKHLHDCLSRLALFGSSQTTHWDPE